MVKGQGQTVKNCVAGEIICLVMSICVFVYALPFEPVVRSWSILELGLPSSANDNCD